MSLELTEKEMVILHKLLDDFQRRPDFEQKLAAWRAKQEVQTMATRAPVGERRSAKPVANAAKKKLSSLRAPVG